MNLLEQLNEQQKEAVCHKDTPLLILAGAGSGKTRVLVHKIAWLMEEEYVLPSQIMAVTFTNKAAKEMKDRIELLVGPKAGKMWIGTFHSICGRILRMESENLPYDKNFSIYDEQDKVSILKKIVAALGVDDKAYAPKSVGYAISDAKNKLQLPGDLQQASGDAIMGKIYAQYQQTLKQNNAMDFDDLIMQTVLLLRSKPEVLQRYQERFMHILVDEYQDTNCTQYELIKLLAAKGDNLCVVGDPDQSIYGWRGADIRNILDFERDYPNCRVIKLEKNYRSTQNILDGANAVISHNSDRKPKDLWTDADAGELIGYHQAPTDRDEAYYVVEKINELRQKEGYRYRDFAILYRTHAQSRSLEEAFVKFNFPYKVFGGLRFYDRKEIKDTLAYLRVLANPADNTSLLRIINEPKRGIGNTTLDHLINASAVQRESVFTLLGDLDAVPELKTAAKSKLSDFYHLLLELIVVSEKATLGELVETIWHKSGYWQALLEADKAEAQSRMENLQEFLSMVVELEKNTPDITLEDFLGSVSLATDMDNWSEVDDYISLLTLHAAKGLEFPVVFLVGMEERIFPHSQALFMGSELEEERRLCYVGMTRAEQKLYLSRAQRRLLWGQENYNQPSRFIGEIPEKLLHITGGESERKQSEGQETSAGRTTYGRNSSFYARNNPKPDASYTKEAKALIQIGDKVQHSKFGVGVVVGSSGSGEDMELKIAFPDQGIKQLLWKYAPIKKI